MCRILTVLHFYRLFPKRKGPLEDNNSYSEQDNLLCTLPRTTLPKLVPPRVTQVPQDFCQSTQVTVNPYNTFGLTATPINSNCDTDTESQYASVVYASPTAHRRLNSRANYNRSHPLSPQVTRMNPGGTLRPAGSSSIHGSPIHRSQMSSTTTLSTCISPRSLRSEYPMPAPTGYDPNLHHVYCEIPLPTKLPPSRPNFIKNKLRNAGGGSGAIVAGHPGSSVTTDETELYGEDTTQCDLHYISDLSDDEPLSCPQSPRHYPYQSGNGSRQQQPPHLIGSPSKSSSKRQRRFQPPPLKASSGVALADQLPATDV